MFLNRIAAIILLLFCLLSLSAHVHLLPQQSTNPCPDKKVSNVLHIVRRSSSDPGYSIDNDCKLYLSHGSALGGGHDAVLVDRNGNMDGLAQHSNGFDSLHDDLAERSNGFGSLNDKSVSSFDSDEHHLSSRHHFEPPDGYPVSFPTEGRPYEGDLFMHDDHHGDGMFVCFLGKTETWDTSQILGSRSHYKGWLDFLNLYLSVCSSAQKQK